MGRTKQFIETLEISRTEWRTLGYLGIGVLVLIVTFAGYYLVSHHR